MRSFTSIQMVDTHTHPPAGGRVIKVRTDEMKMRCKLLDLDAKRGTQKKKEKSKHQHKYTWPRACKPGKGKERKTEADGNVTLPAEEGEDGSA